MGVIAMLACPSCFEIWTIGIPLESSTEEEVSRRSFRLATTPARFVIRRHFLFAQLSESIPLRTCSSGLGFHRSR